MLKAVQIFFIITESHPFSTQFQVPKAANIKMHLKDKYIKYLTELNKT